MYEEISPLLSAIVISSQQPIMTARLPDKRIIATMQSLCDALQIARASQVRRIRTHRLLSKQLLLVPIATKGGWQQMDVLIAWAIPLWLSSIHLTRLTPEKQALVLALQETIVDDLYRYYAELDAKEIAQIVIEQEPSPEPDAAPKDWVEAEAVSSLQDDIWERQYQVMAGFEREWQNMKADIASIRTDIAGVKADVAGVKADIVGMKKADIVGMKADIAALKAAQQQKPENAAKGAERRAEARLSHDHIVHLFVLARSLESRTGEPPGALLRELAAAFQVGDFGELPDSAWDGILAWFWQRSQGTV